MKHLVFIIFAVVLTRTLIAQEHKSDTTLVINKKVFQIKTTDLNNEFVLLAVYCNTKIILTDTLEVGGLTTPEFLDFNKDGLTDIMLTYLGNNNIYSLYLFDKTNNVFRALEGFERFPQSIQLKSDNQYYYSYHRAGCADMNWVSDLFKIENFKTIHVGHIYGQSCPTEVDIYPQVIDIYKITDNIEENGKLIERLSYFKNIKYFGGKWDFIKKYWNKNLKKFK